MARKGQKQEQHNIEKIMIIVNEKLNGASYGSLARKYKVSKGTIKTWVHQYRKRGALKDKKRGRSKQSDETNYKEKYEILKKYLEFLEEVEQEKK
jgi:transposase